MIGVVYTVNVTATVGLFGGTLVALVVWGHWGQSKWTKAQRLNVRTAQLFARTQELFHAGLCTRCRREVSTIKTFYDQDRQAEVKAEVEKRLRAL